MTKFSSKKIIRLMERNNFPLKYVSKWYWLRHFPQQKAQANQKQPPWNCDSEVTKNLEAYFFKAHGWEQGPF